MKLDHDQTRKLGIGLLVFGVVALFDLWGLIPFALLLGGGYAIYRRQSAIGKTDEAFYALFWGVGLAVLLLTGLLWPGVLLLGGASLLLRGHEAEAEQKVRNTLARLPLPRRNAPVAPVQSSSVTITHDQPNTNVTTRLS